MKIGRNAHCPCGSGQKFKNCCLNKPIVNDLVTGGMRKLRYDTPIEIAECPHGHMFI